MRYGARIDFGGKTMPRKKKDTVDVPENVIEQRAEDMSGVAQDVSKASEDAVQPAKRRSRKTVKAEEGIENAAEVASSASAETKRRSRKKTPSAEGEVSLGENEGQVFTEGVSQKSSESEVSPDQTPDAQDEADKPRFSKRSKDAFFNLFAGSMRTEALPEVKAGTVVSSEQIVEIQRHKGAQNAFEAEEMQSNDDRLASEKPFQPFVARKLLSGLVWPSSEPALDMAMFRDFRNNVEFSQADKPHIDGLVDRVKAERILDYLRRDKLFPTARKDFAPCVLEQFSEEAQNELIESEGSRMTAKTMHALEEFLLETIAPNHLASKLVGGAYVYEMPVVIPDPVEAQPAIEITEQGVVDHADDDIDALFAELETPIEAFDYSDFNGEQEGLAYVHTVNHCGRIMALIKHWSLHLRQIDQELKRPADQMPLQYVYYTRFVQILRVDGETASQYKVILPDERLKAKYDLDEMDLFILWLIASLQIDQDVRECLMPTWTQGNIVLMSPATIMRFVATNQMEKSELLFRLSQSARLHRFDLVRTTFTRNPILPLYFELSVPEQISLQFAGTLSLSTPTAKFASLTYPSLSEETFLSNEHKRTLEIVRHFVTRPAINQTNPQLSRDNLNFIPSLPFLIEGLPGSGRTTLMKIIASRLELPLIIVSCGPLAMMAPEDFSSYFNDLFQDAELLNALVCLKDASTILAEARYVALFTRQLALHPIVCALCVDLPVTVSPELDPYVTFKTKMDANLKENAVSYWKPHLSLPFVNNLHVDVLDLSRKLALQPFQIQKAARLAYYATSAEDEAADSMDLAANESDIFLSNQSLERAASAQITKNIGNLAFITDPEVTLNDVIVSDDIMKKIKQIIGSAQNRRRVLYDWGLSKRIRRGTGVICLFDGEPGTGKTHSAEAIAKCLGLSLMRVNIASMVDKYIGETEKNLTKIFEQARPDMSLLLFDEADSLFTKRTSNVSKSNDRYSNMSVNVLLQLVERYEGVSVLTTNLKNSIDPAFERRITYKIYFPMPKKEERIRLWKYMCPPDVLTSEPLDYEWLGEIEMSGGEIKNAVLAGAFKAATMGKLLDTEVLYDAGVTEASAAGRVMRHYDEDDDGFN